jgi:hypothetical protein
MTRNATFQALLGLARHSFLTYVVEASSPVVVDEQDRRLRQLFQDLWEKERHYVERVYELLDESGLRPDPPTFPLSLSAFNFLRPTKLADHWETQVGGEIARLLALRNQVAGDDPCAREFERLVDDLVALRRESVKAVSGLRCAGSNA